MNLYNKLVGWLLNTKRSICANCGEGKLAQSAKDGQRDTMHITLRYTIECNTVQSKTYKKCLFICGIETETLGTISQQITNNCLDEMFKNYKKCVHFMQNYIWMQLQILL